MECADQMFTLYQDNDDPNNLQLSGRRGTTWHANNHSRALYLEIKNEYCRPSIPQDHVPVPRNRTMRECINVDLPNAAFYTSSVERNEKFQASDPLPLGKESLKLQHISVGNVTRCVACHFITTFGRNRRLSNSPVRATCVIHRTNSADAHTCHCTNTCLCRGAESSDF